MKRTLVITMLFSMMSLGINQSINAQNNKSVSSDEAVARAFAKKFQSTSSWISDAYELKDTTTVDGKIIRSQEELEKIADLKKRKVTPIDFNQYFVYITISNPKQKPLMAVLFDGKFTLIYETKNKGRKWKTPKPVFWVIEKKYEKEMENGQKPNVLLMKTTSKIVTGKW